ncbi:hypothetical protein GW17_00027162 [Ensete ventricosum]|nr:hypothetical protein GW17_00027162 [Ensete ventricosum]RZS00846.1 hypothetical protein BHM03_00030623 [Ensete ventricosum]
MELIPVVPFGDYSVVAEHPLRFPNSGIRAKRLAAKVGAACGEGRPHACCLHAEVAGHGQASCRGSKPWAGYLQGAAGCGQAPYKGWSPAGAAARKGRPPTGTAGCGQPARVNRQRLTRKGLPPAASPTATKGGGAGRRGGRPLAGRLPTIKGSRRLRRCSGDGDAVRVKEG